MKRLISVLVLSALFTGAAAAGAPGIVHFQGVLTDDAGLPLTGTYGFTFRLYADTSAAEVWSQSENIDVQGGFYETYWDVRSLGFEEEYFLGVEVGGAPLGPKKALASVPYALAVADGAVGTAALDTTGARAGDVLLFDGARVVWDSLPAAGGDITAVNAGEGLTGGGIEGNVTLSVSPGGIGAVQIAPGAVNPSHIDTAGALPGEGLVFDGNGVVWSSAAVAGGDITAVFAGGGLTGGGPAGDVTLSIDAGGIATGHLADGAVSGGKIADGQVVRSVNGLRDTVHLVAGNQMSIQTVGDSIRFTASISGGGADGDWTISGVHQYSQVTGNVGIGTAAPGEKLDVDGSVRTTGRFVSTQATGTPPLSVSSTTLVSGLNADMLDGNHAADFAASAHAHDGAAITTGTVSFGRLPVGASSVTVAQGDHTHAATDDGDWTVAGDTVYVTTPWVGIGTATPGKKLDIEGDDPVVGIDINNTRLDGDVDVGFQIDGTRKFAIGVDDSDDDKLKIGTSSVGTNTRLTVDGSGNVGIGTTTPEEMLDVDGKARFAGHVLGEDDVYVGIASGQDDDFVYFDSTGVEYLKWDDASARFELSEGLLIDGPVQVSASGGSTPVPYNYFIVGTNPAPVSGFIGSKADLYLGSALETDGMIYCGSYARFEDDIYVGYGSSTGDDVIYMDNISEYIRWYEDSTYFKISDALGTAGPIMVTSSAAAPRQRAYSYFQSDANPNPSSGSMTGASDVFVGDDLEVNDDLLYTGSLTDLSPAPPFTSKSSAAALAAGEARTALESLRPISFPRTPVEEEGASPATVTKLGFEAGSIPSILEGTGGRGYRPLELVVLLTAIVQEQEREIADLKRRMAAMEGTNR